MWKRKPFMSPFHAMKGSNGLNTTIPHSQTTESNDTSPTTMSSSSSPSSMQGRTTDNASLAGPPPPVPSSSSAASVVGVVGSSTKEIPDERLKQAAIKFVDFSKRLHELHQAVDCHHKDLIKTCDSRLRVLAAMTGVAMNSPLQEIMTSTSSQTNACYQNAADAKQTALLIENYQTELLQYVKEWETTVTARVGTEIKHVASLYHTTEKYRVKVTQLKNKVDQEANKPRRGAGLLKKWNSSSNVDKGNINTINQTESLQDKLIWNESKLRNAKRDYRRNLLAVTLFTEEVTDRAWKELVPFLLRHMDLDAKAATSWQQMAKTVAQLRNEMVQLAQCHEMDFESLHKGRLRILREEDAVDFVPHSEWQDLESTVNGNNEKDAALLSPASSNTTRKQLQYGRQDSNANHSAGSANHAAVEVTLQHVYSNHKNQSSSSPSRNKAKHHREDHVIEEEKKFDLEEQSLISGSGLLKYPRYIDVNATNGNGKLDDETTLTGLPDMVSV